MKNKKLKNFIKKHNQLVKVIKSYREGELEEHYQNKFLGDLFRGGQMKLQELDYICFYTAIENLNITNQDTIDLIREEVNGDFSYHHASEQAWSDFENAIKEDWYDKIYTENGTRERPLYQFEHHYSTTYIKSDLFELHEFEDLQYCKDFTAINNIKDCFNNLKIYQKDSYDIYEWQKHLINEVISYIRQYKKRLKSMGEACINYNNSTTLPQDQFESDIQSYIEEYNLIINENINKIKFDYIDRIDGDNIITNKGATAPLLDCKKALEVYEKGENIEGLRLGAYTIKKIFNIKDNIFLRAGCHLIKIDSNLINQLA